MTVKSNTNRQKEFTRRQRDAGLVIYRQWVTPEEKQTLDTVLDLIRHNQAKHGKDGENIIKVRTAEETRAALGYQKEQQP